MMGKQKGFQKVVHQCHECHHKNKFFVGFIEECPDCGAHIEIKPKTLKQANRLIENSVSKIYEYQVAINVLNDLMGDVKTLIDINLPSSTYKPLITQVIKKLTTTIQENIETPNYNPIYNLFLKEAEKQLEKELSEE